MSNALAAMLAARHAGVALEASAAALAAFGGVKRRLEVLGQSSAVLWIEPMAQMQLFDEVASKIVAGDAAPGERGTDHF